MNCEYCGKDMPKSYSYEVGGVVDCGCRDKKNPNNIEAQVHDVPTELLGFCLQMASIADYPGVVVEIQAILAKRKAKS